ncbi:NLRP7 [Branchiostoma lanceolatum]|uniref:NLRP7 protein n=1 Tax=Branchiostoma lanceolatum TaxID=7740 RepID=A0A8K0EUR0_BRALA|nr:NLRP7 [Branchiostoma lanceolatum]
MAKDVNLKVPMAKAISNLGVKDGETVKAPQAKLEKNPPLRILQKEGVKRTTTTAQKSLSWEDDDLDRLYDSRKTAVPPTPAAVRPKQPPPRRTDVACRPPDPLYVRRVGQRFWSTKRILDWQRQALRAREDTEPSLKPVREYGEESAWKNAENEENDGEHGHYENNGEHGHYENDGEHGHYENDGEHGHYENDGEHGHYENDGEHGHYENNGEHGHYDNDEEHKYFQYDKNHGHYENDGEHGHYENDGEHGHYKNDGEHGHYENDGQHGHYENDGEHGHYDNDEEHKYFQYDKNHGHYENDGEHGHYENDDVHSNLSTHVYADLDPDFLALQDAIRLAAAQPFYEMDISPADDDQEQPFYNMDVNAAKDKDKQEQPFYKMDITAAKDKDKQEQPFYEMKVASADEENQQQPFYDMDDNQPRQPTSDNVYAGLDAEFVAAQDAVSMRNRDREGSREGDDDDDPRCSQSFREFFRSHPVCVLAVCVGVIIAVITTAVVPVTFNQQSNPNKSTVPYLTTLPTTLTSTTSSAKVPSETTTDWWTEWALYIREYFQQDSDAAVGLEERYPDNEVVMVLLEDRFFWYWVCRYWEDRTDLPNTLSDAVIYCIRYGTSSEYMESHGFATYREYFSSMQDALEALPNTTKTIQNSDYTYISLSGRTLSDNDVEALANLFPYLRGINALFLSNCGLSAKAATSMAGQLHWLHTLNRLVLSNNNIGDDGIEAISEAYPHLKELRTLQISKNSITNVGGRAMAERLVHLLVHLQKIYLSENELALSLSSLAKAFVNMPRLQSVQLWPITCRAAHFRMAAQQVHDAVHTLEGQVVAALM